MAKEWHSFVHFNLELPISDNAYSVLKFIIPFAVPGAPRHGRGLGLDGEVYGAVHFQIPQVH